VYALAQRLRRRSSSPYDFVRRVQRRVQAGATYSETPAIHDVALDAFLFDDRRGYCQQFSGAMALLLRMGGVPARVAAGFAPGAYEARRREYVVRDVDAHSWVEVYFPRYGWVTLDPTPAIAPPRSQSVSAGGEGGLLVGDRPDRDLTGQAGPAGDGGLEPGHSIAWWPFVLLAVVFTGIALAGAELRRRGRPPGAPVTGELAELVRALHRTGRGRHDALTLVALERLLEGEAAEYVRRLRERRYAGRGAPPTAAHRRALRRALGDGLGTLGRVRAWWALPPGRGPLRRSYTEN
jgi:hypothetical protein